VSAETRAGETGAGDPSAAGGPSAPIGVFDSGVGGLSVAAALRRRLPAESFGYRGDTARLPYGSKSPETVTQYTRKNVDFLLGRGVKAVVVACNTASALALPHLEPRVPTWGVIGPGARRAAAATRGRVGVIATQSTVRSDAYGKALRALRPGVEVTSRACPLFVPLVEEGWHDDPVTEEVARRYLGPLLEGGVDTLVLGCTHYPLLRPLLARVAGDGVALVDSAETVAEEVAAGLAAAGLAAPPGAAAEHSLYLTDTSEGFAELARRILDDPAVAISWIEVV
jgi:glutamate racemase